MHISVPIGPIGPIIIAQIGPSVQKAMALQQAGQPVPALVTANLLIDTGASCTALDHNVVAQLGLTPTGTTPVHTPSTGTQPHIAPLYDVSMSLMNNVNQRHVVPALAVMASNFSAQGGMDGLLGRDVLGQVRMTYGGVDGFVLLSF